MSRRFARRVYDRLPLKKAFCILIKKTGILPPRLRRHLYFRGDFRVPVGSQSLRLRHYGFQYHVENEIFWNGIEDGYERVSISLWMKLAAGVGAGAIVDVGANTGIYSLLAKLVNPAATVIAFEPLERIMDKLETNARLNGLSITCERKALSNYTGTAEVFPTSLDHVYSVLVNQDLWHGRKAVHRVSIAAQRFEDYIRERGVPGVALLKIDVETHEPEVLEGMGSFLMEMRPDMLIEVQNDEVGSRVERLIESCGYRYFNIDERGGVRPTKRLGKSDYANCLVCKPETATRLGLAG